MAVFEHSIESSVRGFHIYKTIWEPFLHEQLETARICLFHGKQFSSIAEDSEREVAAHILNGVQPTTEKSDTPLLRDKTAALGRPRPAPLKKYRAIL